MQTVINFCDPPFLVPHDTGQGWIDHISVAKRALATMMRPTDSTLAGGDVPVPAASGALTQALAPPKPKRIRRPSLTTIVKQALKAGADRVEYRGAVIHLRGDGRPQATNGNAAAAPERNEWDEKYGHH